MRLFGLAGRSLGPASADANRASDLGSTETKMKIPFLAGAVQLAWTEPNLLCLFRNFFNFFIFYFAIFQK